MITPGLSKTGETKAERLQRREGLLAYGLDYASAMARKTADAGDTSNSRDTD